MGLVVFILIGILSVVRSTEYVVDLVGQGDIDRITSESELLTLFHAPWCRHCKAFMPAVEEVAADIVTPVVGKVDCTRSENEPVCARYNISGYPTLKLLDMEGHSYDYTGPRNKAQLAAWINTMRGVTVRPLILDELYTYQIGFVLLNSRPEDVVALEAVARQHKGECYFGETPESEVMGMSGEGPTILVLRNGERMFTVPFDKDTIADVLEREKRMLVSRLTNDKYTEFYHETDRHFWILVMDTQDSEQNERLNELRDLSAELRESPINFAFTDGNEYSGFIKQFGAREMPFHVVFKPQEHKYALMQEPIREAVHALLQGEVEFIDTIVEEEN